MSFPPLIDVHHHLIPAPVRARLAASGITQVGGITVPDWVGSPDGGNRSGHKNSVVAA
jgi:hypothetical protein